MPTATNGITISPEILTWAYQRAGYEGREQAVAAFPDLGKWLSNEKTPTIKKLQAFATKFFVPFGYLFLNRIPDESLPFTLFRGGAGRSDHFDVNVYDTILCIRRRQDWLETYLSDNGMDTCQVADTIRLTTPPDEAVSLLRDALQLPPDWAFEIKKVDDAVKVLAQRLEEAGFFLSFNSVVENNTHRPIDVDQCRGFALFSPTAPYIFVNSADSKAAQMFTLVHEAVHIMLGRSAGHAGQEWCDDDRTEVYCNQLAAEFLVPADLLHRMWPGEVTKVSERFKVSHIVIARRAHDLGLMSHTDYNSYMAAYHSQPLPIEKKTGGGGDFYKTSQKRIGIPLATHVRNAVSSRQLSYTEAYRLTGLYGRTYQRFISETF